jgi:hypothetical protein
VQATTRSNAATVRRAFAPFGPCLVVLACHGPAPGLPEQGARPSPAPAALSGLNLQEKLSKLLGATGR